MVEGAFLKKLTEPFLLWAFFRAMNRKGDGRLRLSWARKKALASGLFSEH